MMWDSPCVESSDVEGPPLPPEGQADNQRDPVDKALLARLIVGALILAACITFAVQNLDGVETQFLGWSFQMSQFLLMLLSAVAGVLVWEVAGAYSRRAKKKQG